MSLNVQKVLTALAIGAALCACGGDIDVDDEDTTFTCEDTTCDTDKGEFCWFQRFANTGETHSATCLAPTTACTSCACAEDAVADELDGASNCDSLVSCSQDGGAITLVCTNPQI